MPANPQSSYPVINPGEHPLRFSQFIEAMVNSKNIFVVCGDTLAHEAGLPSLDDPVDEYYSTGVRKKKLRSLLHEWCPSIVSPDVIDQRIVASANAAMANRRIKAREAKVGPFATLLTVLWSQGRIDGYLTTAFDGLESRAMPNSEDVVFRLHGDNRQLRCGRPLCSGHNPEQSMAFDGALLAAPTAVQASKYGSVFCTDCRAKWKKTAIALRKFKETTLLLRPAVKLNLDVHTWMEGEGTTLLDLVQKSRVLLIVETSLKSRGGLDHIVSDLADTVRKNSGVVLCVSPDALKGKAPYTRFDAQLQISGADFALHMAQAIEQVQTQLVPPGEKEYDNDEYWSDILNSQLSGTSVDWEDNYVGEHCQRCCSSVPDYLIRCHNCGEFFCHRRVSYDDSWTPDPGSDSRPTTQDLPSKEDTFVFEDACIILHEYSPTGRRPDLVTARKNFICFHCWDRSKGDLYPHYVRPILRARDQPEGTMLPRTVIIVFYAEQFWPQASQILAIVSSRWANKGWACKTHPVKIEHVGEQKPILDDLNWEPQTYVAGVIYVTHGLHGDRGYQVSSERALPPQEFLDGSLYVAERLLRNARSAWGGMLCCGGLLQQPVFVEQLEEWLNKPGALLETLVCAMNVRLASAYMVNLMAKISTAMADSNPEPAESLFRLWISDTIAASHTNILFLARQVQPTLWLYAPFQSRPLGKPLPSILSVCSCPGLSSDFHERRRRGSRKFWKVTHDGRDGQAIGDVVVRARCSICGQTWPLLCDYFAGTLRKHAGVFATVVPYFASTNVS